MLVWKLSSIKEVEEICTEKKALENEKLIQ